MNEDITQEIYYCMIKAGYDEKIADILCGNEYLKKQFENNRKEALYEADQKMVKFYELMKDAIIEIFAKK